MTLTVSDLAVRWQMSSRAVILRVRKKKIPYIRIDTKADDEPRIREWWNDVRFHEDAVMKWEAEHQTTRNQP